MFTQEFLCYDYELLKTTFMSTYYLETIHGNKGFILYSLNAC